MTGRGPVAGRGGPRSIHREGRAHLGNGDPGFITQTDTLGRGLAAGANYYFEGHSLKLQADWAHSFGGDFGLGPHLVRVQLDGSF
jgi:hypothetical protein